MLCSCDPGGSRLSERTPADCVVVHIDFAQAPHHVQLIAGTVAIAALLLIVLALHRQGPS